MSDFGRAKSDAFARRINRNDWIMKNSDRRLSDAEEMAFAIVLSVAMGGLMAVGFVSSIQAADAILSR